MNNQFISGKKATEILGVKRHTLYKYEREGLIKTIRSPGGKRFYNIKEFLEKNNIDVVYKEDIKQKNRRNICYARVSSHSQKNELENQKNILKQVYPITNYYMILEVELISKEKNF